MALQDPIRFLAYAMRYASPEDMVKIRKYISDESFAEALDKIPPGIVDARSWAYWNAVFGRYPTPPLKPVNAPADWVPWHLSEMYMDLGVNASGTAGIVTAVGEAAVELKQE